jgi:hypothetical protein
MVGWPSGLRRQIKALVSSEARVQIPPQPLYAHLAEWLRRCVQVAVSSEAWVRTPQCAFAWMAEGSKAVDLSSILSGGVGSNPTSSIFFSHKSDKQCLLL